MPTTIDEMTGALRSQINQTLELLGLTAEYLLRKDKRLLSAKKTVFQKVKASIPENARLPRGVTVVYSGTDESLLAIRVADLGLQHSVAVNLHKIRGDYPSERLDVTHSGVIGLKEFLEQIDGQTAGPTVKDADHDTE